MTDSMPVDRVVVPVEPSRAAVLVEPQVRHRRVYKARHAVDDHRGTSHAVDHGATILTRHDMQSMGSVVTR